MEFVAKLDDQMSAPTAALTEAQLAFAAAVKGADEKLRLLDSSQQKVAKRSALTAAAFNPKAYQQQILAERQLAAAKDAALQKLGLGLSQKEKDEAATKKAAAEERKRAREAAAQRAATGLGGAAAQAKALALSLGAVVGVSGGLGLAKIAIGYQGMARLSAISYQAGLNVRSLFRGVDSRPLERAYLQFTKLFSLSTTTGQSLSDGMTRGFNGLFSAVEKAEPYVSAFVRGAILGGMKLEVLWLRARIWLFPFTAALGDATGKIDGIKVAAYAGMAAVGLLAAKATGVLTLGGAALTASKAMTVLAARGAAAGLAATGAAAPFLAFAAAIGAVVAAGYQLSKLIDEWDTDLVLRSLGIRGESDADRMNRQFDEEAAARAKAGKKSRVQYVDQLPTAASAAPAAAPAVPKAPVDKAAASGRALGRAMSDGVLAGLKERERALEAGGAAAAGAVQRGVQTKAEIHSPARAFRRDAQQMGEGTRLGLKDSESKVQKAAEESLVPSPRMAQGGAAGGAPAGVVLHLTTGDIIVGAGMQREEVRESFDEAMAALVQQVGAMLGAPRAEVSRAGG
ncbi:hypothetical protein [Sorangium cellulosum]|uniref:Uncharacterized protein n=1 Tax=Sorangium cellulosum TaxID=56 RepID=A0A150Q9I1_SORCE|nr:hypothetical protein [Sorangium cellulosum]KYF64532.1 hypothetical protein BE15_04510 [Sorangium cellulosum]